MSNRFKFRIYDLEQKHYLRVIQDETTGAEGFAAFYGEYNNICKPMSFFLCHNIDRWVIEQCTGLKDKNGNLIYEGDILLLYNNKFEVGNNNITVFFKCLTDKYTHIDPMDFDYNESEIIGNIHEYTKQKIKKRK